MADIVWNPDVTDEAAELATLSVGTQNAVLAIVNQYFNPDKFGGVDGVDYKTVRVLMAAHMATILIRRGATGQVTSSSAGGLARSFSTMMTPAGLGVTGYGSLLDMMLHSNPGLRGTNT